jgi:hypothetical protein
MQTFGTNLYSEIGLTVIDFFMITAAISYVGAATGYAWKGMYWMGVTLLFYAATIGTIYMAGNK